MPPLSQPLAFGLTGGLPPWVLYLDQDYFLALVNRLLPQEYLAPLFSPGPGAEIYFAQARIGYRVSVAIANYDAASYITTAPDGAFAEAPIRFSRPTATAGAVIVKAGTIVQTSVYGRQFSLVADVTFGASDLFADGIARATSQGEQWNAVGPYVTAGGESVPGQIDTVVFWSMDPPYGDPTITMAQLADGVGGQSSVLNMHGADRGLPRHPNEYAPVYRNRIRSLPDTVSPTAFIDYLNNTLSPLGAQYEFIETFQASYQTAFDCPSPNIGTPTYQPVIPAGLDTNLFVYDDPRSSPPFNDRWLSIEDFRGGIIVTVPNLPAMTDVGMAYDDTATTPGDLITTIGYRSVSAYDIPSGYSASSPGGYDGFDLAKQAVYKGLFDSLQKIKSGGVDVAVELQGE